MKIEGFSKMLEEIQKERGVAKETLVDAICMALISAYRKKFQHIENLSATIDNEGVAKVIAKKIAVTKVKDDSTEISKKDAKKINPKVKVGDEVEIDVTPTDFGRLAAQTAKQVIIQRIREAEKEGAFEEYIKKQGEIINGIVQRREANGYLVNMGRIETLLPFSESIPGENYRPSDRIKIFIVETKKTPKGPMVNISRTHPNFLKKLFEIEIPEISQGIIEIKGVSREPGRRSKVAVFSKDKNIGAVGTCIGHMGNRIQNIVREIGTERVDVIEWNENPKTFISNALSPAKIARIETNAETNEAKVIVPEDQLSLAIGKEGQNVRLAAKLTGWKIDILSAAKVAEEEKIKEEKAKEEKPKEKEKETKIKIKEAAEELGVEPKEMLEKAKELGIEVKTVASSIDNEDKKKIAAALKAKKAEEKPEEEKASAEEGKKEGEPEA